MQNLLESLLYDFHTGFDGFIACFPCGIEPFKDTMGDEFGAVEMQNTQMVGSAVREGKKHSVILFTEMLSHVIEERIEEAQVWLGAPVISFEFVAGMAAINEIIGIVIAALMLRLNVVNRQLRSYIRFADTTVRAAVVVPDANRLPQGFFHQWARLVLRMR